MDVESSILVWLRFGEPGGTHPPVPRIFGVFTTHSRVVLIRSFHLIFPYLEPISAVFTKVVHILYLVRVLYPVRSPCFILTDDQMALKRNPGAQALRDSSLLTFSFFICVFFFLWV